MKHGQKQLSRAARLKSAKRWIAEYRGKNLISGYRNWFGVSGTCAIQELRMLGVEIDESRLDTARRNEQARAARRAQCKQERTEPEGCENGCAFVAGCTPCGAPYGIEQDVADAAWEQTLAWLRVMDEGDEDDDLPF